MAKKRTLGDLKKLARPALRHAELVDLAMTYSPTEAHKRAMARWPRRPASACRFLAILRRDHPSAFTAFITKNLTKNTLALLGKSTFGED